MSLDGFASVQSRIAAIEQRIAALDAGGRPPVALTESGAANAAKSSSATAFANALNTQVNSINGVSNTGGASSTAEAFVAKVRSYIGIPYVWGGTNPATGLDCSGLVQTAAREVGVTVPRVTWDQQNAGTEIPSIDQAKPGDILITNGGAHVAVFVGDGKAVEAPRPGMNVHETTVASLGPIKTIRRIMPDDAPKVNPAANQVAASNNAAAAAASQLAMNAMLSSGSAGLAAGSSAGLGLMNNSAIAQNLLGVGGAV